MRLPWTEQVLKESEGKKMSGHVRLCKPKSLTLTLNKMGSHRAFEQRNDMIKLVF